MRVVRWMDTCALGPAVTLEAIGDEMTAQVDATFSDFCRRERPGLVALAYALSGSRWAAEELAQEALIRALRNWDRIHTYDNPGGWVRRVTINLATSAARRTLAETKALVALKHLRERPLPSLDGEAQAFWDAVRSLPRAQRDVVALFYLEDRSVAEIAQIVGRSEGTVKANLHHARQSLARLLTTEDEYL